MHRLAIILLSFAVAHASTSLQIPLKRKDYGRLVFPGQALTHPRPHPQGLGLVDQTPLILAVNITDPTKRAESALSALQIWYNAGTGLWNTAGWWNSANVMTMVANLAKYDSNPKVQDLAKQIFAVTIVQAPANNPQPGVEDQNVERRDGLNDTEIIVLESGYDKIVDKNGEYTAVYPKGWNSATGAFIDVKDLPIKKAGDPINAVAAVPNPDEWLDGFYDDDLWWALGWIGAYDVTQNIEYLQLAEGIFMKVTKAWPTRCGNGGIWWSWRKDYMNAIANELFLSTAAHLANRAENKSFYIDWSERTLDWFLKSEMINEKGTINDGLTEDCNNNGHNTWSYNQGVILGGLVELNRASPNDTYLPLAHKIAQAAIEELSDDNGIIHDKCGPLCGGDASQFKGIFARNLQILQATDPKDIYKTTIQKNADSIWNNDRNDGNQLSIDWAGPFIETANATTHSSAMDALVAAITV